MGKKIKKPKTSVVFDDKERETYLFDRLKANKTRKAEIKKKQEFKIREEKREFRKDKMKVGICNAR
jgi:hypothetical protein